MPGPEAADEVSLVQPPPKRRRVDDDGSASATPHHGSYDSPKDHDKHDRRPGSAKAKEPSPQNLSIRHGRQPSRSSSRIGDANGDTAGQYRRTPTNSPTSRSRSRSRRRARSYTSSRSRSRSRSRADSQRSSSGSRSRSPSRSRSRSPSRSRRRRSHSASSPTPSSSSRRRTGSPPPALEAPPQEAPPLRPAYKRRLELRGHAAAVSQVRISPDGRWIASASADGTAKIWNAGTGAHMDTLVGHMAGVSCVAWAPDGDTLATGSDDKAIRLWDRVTASPAHASGGDGDGPGGGKDYGPGGTAGLVAARARIRNGGSARGGRTGRGPLLGHHNYVYCLAFSPKGNILASGSYDEAVFLWDVRAGRLMRSLPAHSDPVSGIDFCRDGTLVVSCSTDGLIRIWDTSTGQCLRTLVHEDNPAVTNVCFSPNGRFVLAFSLDSCIRLWDYVAGSVKKTYQGHKNSGFSVGGSFGALEEGGNEEGVAERRSVPFVASASEDGDIVMWDVRSKEVVQRIAGAHEGTCFWVDVHGGTMASAGKDGKINVFRHKPRRKKSLPAAATEGEGDKTQTNGVHNRDHDRRESGGPASSCDDDELQRQVETEAASRQLKQEDIKMEEDLVIS